MFRNAQVCALHVLQLNIYKLNEAQATALRFIICLNSAPRFTLCFATTIMDNAPAPQFAPDLA